MSIVRYCHSYITHCEAPCTPPMYSPGTREPLPPTIELTRKAFPGVRETEKPLTPVWTFAASQGIGACITYPWSLLHAQSPWTGSSSNEHVIPRATCISRKALVNPCRDVRTSRYFPPSPSRTSRTSPVHLGSTACRAACSKSSQSHSSLSRTASWHFKFGGGGGLRQGGAGASSR